MLEGVCKLAGVASITNDDSITNSITSGSAMIYWIEPLTLDQRVAGLIPVNTCTWHFCPSARQFIHIAAQNPGVL